MRYWCWRPNDGRQNFGDELTGLLLRYIFPDETHEWVEPERAQLVGVGSVLHTIRPRLQPGTIIWGSGGGSTPYDVHEMDVRAVRGPLTRDLCGLPEDTALGDPAILLPLFIPPAEHKRHKIGLVRHMDDTRVYDHPHMDGAHEISVYGPPEDVVRQITECEYVVSSSLHGWIVAVAYGIPTMPIPIDEGTKFYDFMQFLIECQSLETARARLLAQLQG